jgi:hypothetical protein
MSCCKTYDPCLDNKINQIGSYASVARQSAQSATDSAAAASASAAAAAISAGTAGIYLGAFAVPPTTDNEGGQLQDGMLYYNTGSNTLFVWNGSSWSAIQDDEIYLGGFAVAPTLNNQGLPLVSGNLYWNSVSNNLWAYDGVAWIVTTSNMPTGGGTNKVFYLNDNQVTVDYTLPPGQNAMSAGPITVNLGVIVTIPPGQAWTIV